MLFWTILLLPAVIGRQWSYDEYPALHDSRCNRPNGGSTLCDPDRVLTRSEAEDLDEILEEARRIACPCSSRECAPNNYGYTIGVAILEKFKLDRSYEDEFVDTELRLTAAYRMAGQLQQSTWQLGRCEEDVIVVYSKNDGVVYILTSRLARRRLSDQMAGEIIRDSAEAFSNGDNPFRGLERVLKQVRDALQDRYRRGQYARYD